MCFCILHFSIGCPECFNNSACGVSEYCCELQYLNDINVCRRNCIGESCHSNLDCGGPGECCRGNKCVKLNNNCDECQTNSDCPGRVWSCILFRSVCMVASYLSWSRGLSPSFWFVLVKLFFIFWNPKRHELITYDTQKFCVFILIR